MKTIYKSFFTLICLAGSFSLSAQQDTTITRQVRVEREYTPVIQDASKINTLPAVQESAKPNTNVKYVTELPRIDFYNFPIKDMGSGSAATDIDFSKKRGYLTLGVGSNLNIDGRLGYRIVGTESDRLDAFVSYNSANSNVDYEDQNYKFKKAKAKYSDLFAKLKYEHSFASSLFYVNGSFLNTMFNYYGNSFLNDYRFLEGVEFPKFSDRQQRVSVFGGEIGIKSDEWSEISYLGELRFHHFDNKFDWLGDDGEGGNLLELKAGVGAAFDSDKKVGLEFGLLHQSFTDVASGDDRFHDLTSLKARAHFDLDGDIWNLSIGAKVNYAIDKKNRFLIAPDIRASVSIADKTSIYAIVTGGINDNDFISTLMENRYVTPVSRVDISRTPFDATLGFKIGAVRGIEFDIFGGYKYTKDDHSYTFLQMLLFGGKGEHYKEYFRGFSGLNYSNIYEGHVGGEIKTSLIPYTDLSLKAKAYFYDAKYSKSRGSGWNSDRKTKAWGRPTFTLDFNADVKPIDNLTLTLNYIYKGGRKNMAQSIFSYGILPSSDDLGPIKVIYEDSFRSRSFKMKDVSELNLRGEYQLFDWLSLNASLNNILNQKYEMYAGYTLQGFHAMAGVSIKF
ncbi:hypothetical protein [Dysgonomonas sp. 520]|uniref:hypothetical protein n=1 Tax=Dysgonomonas sp. 520 TaxID=2302931 RepID=UPI0013D2B2B6|nr:hypothetical protein [Dysgonomonas sp. 520]NDW10270.1 hypothetical protein [Dysgonomonas sp. 520]